MIDRQLVAAAEVEHLWDVTKPPKAGSWWRRARARRACRRFYGHCYHPEDLIGWFCCVCGGEVDGMPAQRCVLCRG